MGTVSVRMIVIVVASVLAGVFSTVGVGFGLAGWKLPHQVDAVQYRAESKAIRDFLAQDCNFQFWSLPDATQRWETLLEYQTVDERMLFLVANGWVKVPPHVAEPVLAVAGRCLSMMTSHLVASRP